MNDLVSIITPTYNCANFIEATIKCVLSQTYLNWELIISDDCSTDNTEQLVLEYIKLDKRIYYIRNSKNSGAAIARNNALQRAKGKWIAFLDSDDLWTPDKLEKQINFMKANNYFFSYHMYKEIDEQSKELGVLVSGKRHVSKFDMNVCCWPGCLSVMYDATYIGLIQIDNIKKNNDTAMWLKIIRKTQCHLLPECLGYYRRRKGSITPPSIGARIKWHYTLFHDAEHMSSFFSIILMCLNILGNTYKKLFFVKKYNVN